MYSYVKMPMDPYIRQPTPLYERTKCPRGNERKPIEKPRNSNILSARIYNKRNMELKSAREDYNNFLEFIQSIPNYLEVHHLSNEQFKQKLDYLKRKQRILLKNLHNCFEQEEKEDKIAKRYSVENYYRDRPTFINKNNSENPQIIPESELKLKDKRYNYKGSKINTSYVLPSRNFSYLATLPKDQDFLTYRRKKYDKPKKIQCNEEFFLVNKTRSSESESKNDESLESHDQEISDETKSLSAHNPKRWHSTLPKPFKFTLKDDAEKYMMMIEKETDEEYMNFTRSKKNLTKKRRIKPIPLSSKIPLYHKFIAAKEERSRIVREESALSLMSQVQPFKLECDQRALRALTRSSPDLREKKTNYSSSRFKAKPVPKNLFSTDFYNRMFEDAYCKDLQKRIRAVELMRSSSLPPSMARRSRCKSLSSSRSLKASSEERRNRGIEYNNSSVTTQRNTLQHSESLRPSTITTTLPPHGSNLAALLRVQVSREKLERNIQEQLEKKRHSQMLRLRKTLIGRKPEWRALRSAARHEHERDLYFRTSLRRDEAREQAERHRIQMEMMHDRVTRTPTLFERYSQNFQSSLQLCPNLHDYSKLELCKRKKSAPKRRQSSSSADSYASFASSWRPNSRSLTSSSETPVSLSRSSGVGRTHNYPEIKKQNKVLLKVSNNETAEPIKDRSYKEKSILDYAHRVEKPCDKAILHIGAILQKE